MTLLRLLKIIRVGLHFGLDEFFLGHERVRGLRVLLQTVFFWRRYTQPRAVRLRLALEALGPIFVKFGQILSTRRDMLPADIADELARFTALNETYKKRFGFPFIMAVKGATKEQILAGFERRLAHEPETEFNEALAQIEKIALLRLSDRLPS